MLMVFAQRMEMILQGPIGPYTVLWGLKILGHGPRGSTRHPLSDPLRPILFCSLDPSKHEKWMPPSPNWDELPVWRHFQNGCHGNWQNHVFAYNSASRVDRNEISVSTPILFRVGNSIKAFTGFYDFYLTHDELPVWLHFQNVRHGNWPNHVFAYNSASRVDRNEISVSTPIFLRVGNSIKALTSFYNFYLTHDELPVWRHFQNGRPGNWQNRVFFYNSASRVDRNEISVSIPIFLRVGNSIKALTSFYNFYLTHNELPVWRHFQNGRHEKFCL